MEWPSPTIMIEDPIKQKNGCLLRALDDLMLDSREDGQSRNYEAVFSQSIALYTPHGYQWNTSNAVSGTKYLYFFS